MQAREWLAVLVCTLLACAANTLPAQSASDPSGTLSIVGDGRVHVVPQTLAENVFTVGLVDSHGAPMPGVLIEFGARGDGCADWCAPPQMYGHFTDGLLEHIERDATDADGRATAHAFTAGAVAGVYQVSACALGIMTNGTALCVDFTVHQVALGSTLPITSGFTGAWYDPS